MAITHYILQFRGVGGATQLPVARLREALSAGGFENVATYINSGNAVVRSGWPSVKVVKVAAAICRAEFGFEKAIYALTLKEWVEVIENNPFPDAVAVPKFLHAAVLGARPASAAVDALRRLTSPGERLDVVGNVAYLHTPNGFGTSKLAGKFDKGIGVPSTARNWNTVLKLRELAQRVGTEPAG